MITLLNLILDDVDLDTLTLGGVLPLDTDDFNAWDAITGPQNVTINGHVTRALVWNEEPSCLCCRGYLPAYHWSLQLL